jgi:hypothetical protein
LTDEKIRVVDLADGFRLSVARATLLTYMRRRLPRREVSSSRTGSRGMTDKFQVAGYPADWFYENDANEKPKRLSSSHIPVEARRISPKIGGCVFDRLSSLAFALSSP